jgi:hypothetical protein
VAVVAKFLGYQSGKKDKGQRQGDISSLLDFAAQIKALDRKYECGR